jgi:metacaspase-1
MPKGISLHIGLNHVDATAYGGWDGALAAAVHDAHDMAVLASSEGYRTQLLTDRQATATAVLTAIRTAGGKLRPGDVFMLSYSGHGGQLVDTTPEGELDGFDETWVCWDRQLLDDEVSAALASFARDVRVIIAADTSHSGTNVRSALAPSPPVRTPEGARRARIIPAAAGKADQSRRHALYQRIRRSSRAEIRRAMARQRALTRRQAGMRKPTSCLSARVVLLTACQDNEVAYDGPGNGAFTNALLTTWANGRFDGTYRDFVSAIRTKLSAQTPGCYSIGRGASGWEASRPFTIDIRHDLELIEDPSAAQPD